MKSNGAGTVTEKELTTDEKLDVVIAGISSLEDKIEALTEQQEELAERVANISLSGDGFNVDDYGGN